MHRACKCGELAIQIRKGHLRTTMRVGHLALLSVLAMAHFCLAEGPGGYVDPATRDGKMTTTPVYLDKNVTKGQPMNVIISNKSEASILEDLGAHNFYKSLGFLPGPCHTKDDTNRTKEANVGGIGWGAMGSEDAKWQFPECGSPTNPVLRFTYWIQYDALGKAGATFISAAMTVPDEAQSDDTVIENGYDLGRDQFIARVTLNNTGAPVLDRTNKTQEFKTSVVYNDTKLLSNITADDLQFNIGTDGRIPILLVEKTDIPNNETPKTFPLPGSQAGITSYLPTTLTIIMAVMVGLIPMAFIV